MDFYTELAKQEASGSSDGDYFLTNQKGIILLHGLIYKQSTTKKTVILVGEIVESNAKVAGAVIQTPGTKVKKIYSISKYDWHLRDLKTDLVNIMGLDESEMTPKNVSDLMADVFEGAERKGPDIEKGILRGVLSGFDCSTKEREGGKEPLTLVRFFEVKEGNEEKDVIARRAKLK